jgi:hypothetical protein
MKDVSSWGRWEQTGPNTWQGRAAAEGEVDSGSRVPGYPLRALLCSLLAFGLLSGWRVGFQPGGVAGVVNAVSMVVSAGLALATGGLWLGARQGPARAQRARSTWAGPWQAGHTRPVRVSGRGEVLLPRGELTGSPIADDEMIRLHELMAGDGDFRTWIADGPERWSRGSGSGA